jgi:hypothetical protein
MADGITKQFEEVFATAVSVGDKAKEAIKEQLDIEAQAVFNQLNQTAPRGKTLGLVNSLTKSQIIDSKNIYGYSIEFVGSDVHGTPYQKIANILNYGTSAIQGTRFVNKAIRKLKGLDERIAERFGKKTN